jgi:hypothetical protein
MRKILYNQVLSKAGCIGVVVKAYRTSGEMCLAAYKQVLKCLLTMTQQKTLRLESIEIKSKNKI